MDLTFGTEERAFEKEVRDFIAVNLAAEMKHATALTPSVFSDPDIGMAWQRALHTKGWGAPGWPVDHGGPDWTPAQRWIFEAESARAGVPNVNVMGVTEELDIGSYFKRLLAFDTLFGGSAYHYRRHAALGGKTLQT